ncbi:MAG: hypothetical protein KME64_01310 [Scytonematopsis contorta HA4267-MV1]|nr:hypothetical protein [Scytonematopsis contorta HA4267-MV1]
MFSENQNHSSLQQRLLNGLAGLPSDWPLTPVGGDKKPYLRNWQKQPQEREIIANNIKLGVTTCNYKRPNLQSKHFQTRIICNYNYASTRINCN